MKSTFKMSLFVKQLEEHPSYSKDDKDRYEKLLPLINHFFDEVDVDEEILEKYTTEEFEWFYNIICYWPTYEMECEREDLNHEGVQSSEILDFIKEVSSLPQVKRKVTFI